MDQIQEAYINLALALRQAGEYEEAAAVLRKAVERAPEMQPRHEFALAWKSKILCMISGEIAPEGR